MNNFKTLFLLLFFIPFVGKSQHSTNTITYTVDTVTSNLEWQCDSHNGIVPLRKGVLKLLNGQIVSGNFVINMDSLKDEDIDYKLMRKTLQNTLTSTFFFDTKKFHSATFIIDYAEPIDKNRYLVTGDLTIKGITQCIQFNSNLTVNKKGIKAVSDTFSIDRTQWGITIYSKQMSTSDDSVIVSDEINFVIHLSGKFVP